METRTQGGFDVADIEGLYRNFGTEYKRLPALHDRLWSFFQGVVNKLDREQFRQVLTPKFATDSDGQEYDERQKLRDDFYAALTEFGLCLQTALSSRSFFEDKSFSYDPQNIEAAIRKALLPRLFTLLAWRRRSPWSTRWSTSRASALGAAHDPVVKCSLRRYGHPFRHRTSAAPIASGSGSCRTRRAGCRACARRYLDLRCSGGGGATGGVDRFEAGTFDGVTAALRVNAGVHSPLLCVANVFKAATGNLSLLGKINK